MVGGGSRRDDGPLGISNTNVFAALESLRRKKKSDKEHGSSKSKGSSKNQAKEPEPQVYWTPAPLTVKSWADVDDDDDYYATTAPPSAWGSTEPRQSKDSSAPVEESESEEDGIDLGDDDVEEEHEEEHDHEPEVLVQAETVVKKPSQASVAPKEAERQLSKKELKKKGLEELDALLAELGIPKKDTPGPEESRGAAQDKKEEELNGYSEKKENATGESKSAKKKKKKDKSSKEAKESHDQLNGSDNAPDETAGTEQAEETSSIDVKERIKKVASMKKKKSSKEMDAAAKAAAVEAAARSARLAAAKKKEKNHYNQQPVR